MTEKQLLAATFLAIVGLAEKLTGKKMSITVVDNDGNVETVCGAEYCVTWTDEGPETIDRATLAAVRREPPEVQRKLAAGAAEAPATR